MNWDELTGFKFKKVQYTTPFHNTSHKINLWRLLGYVWQKENSAIIAQCYGTTVKRTHKKMFVTLNLTLCQTEIVKTISPKGCDGSEMLQYRLIGRNTLVPFSFSILVNFHFWCLFYFCIIRPKIMSSCFVYNILISTISFFGTSPKQSKRAFLLCQVSIGSSKKKYLN